MIGNILYPAAMPEKKDMDFDILFTIIAPIRTCRSRAAGPVSRNMESS